MNQKKWPLSPAMLDRSISMAALIDVELMPKDLAPNSRDLTEEQVCALAAKFARWAEQCSKTAAAMEALRLILN